MSTPEPPVTADHTPERLSAWTTWFHRELVNCVHPAGVEPQCETWARRALTTGPAAHLADVEARLAAVEALLRSWDEWDGTRPHPGESSPRQREQLRAALHPTPSDNRPASMFQTPGFDHEDPDLSPQEPRL